MPAMAKFASGVNSMNKNLRMNVKNDCRYNVKDKSGIKTALTDFHPHRFRFKKTKNTLFDNLKLNKEFTPTSHVR